MVALHIVALGSSFAAGPRIPPQINRSAGRSGANYAHLLADRLGARLTDLSVSGATLQNIISEPQATLRRTFAPQLSEFPTDVDVVTITAGGNDLNYVGGIMLDALNRSFFGRLLARFLPISNDQVSLEAEDVKERFIAIIDAIRKISPRCRIFLVEYLTLFGENTTPGVDISFDEARIKHYQNIAATLQTAYRLAAEARSECCKLVPIAELSQNHDIGSAEPWVEGSGFWMMLKGKAPFHPNAKGMQAVADVLYEELK